MIIETSALRKSFVSRAGREKKTVEAVRGVDLLVAEGEVFGFLGPNGAGKSSTMRMIGAVSPVSGGELRILGMDPRRDGIVPSSTTVHSSEATL